MWRMHFLNVRRKFSPCIFSGPKEKINSTFPYSGNLSSTNEGRRYLTGQLAETITKTGTIIRLLSLLYLWRSRQAHLSQRRRWGHEGHKCETAPGTSRLDKGCGSVCGSTWANGWKNKVDEGSSPSRAKRTQQGRLVRFDSGWREALSILD